MVFKKRGKLKVAEKLRMIGQNIEVADKFNYLVMFRSTGGWNNQKMLVKTKGCEVLMAIDKCLSVTPSVKVHMLENIYEMVCESNIMCRIEVWRLNEAWKKLDKVHSRLDKKLMSKLY